MNKSFNIDRVFNIEVNKPVLFIQTGFLFLAYYRYQKMSNFLLTAALSNEARAHYFDDFYSSYTELLLNQIVDSFLFISYFFAFGLLFFHKNKLTWKEWYIILSTLAIVVLNTLTSFGRNIIFQLVVVFVLFFLLCRHFDKNIFKKRIKPASLVFIGLVAVVFVITTMVRANLDDAGLLGEEADDLFLKPFVTYFYVPICAFDIGSMRVFNDIVPMLGAADFAGFIDFLLTPIRIFDHGLYSPNMVLGARMTPTLYFPSGETWNALYTGASNYYIDFGFLGFIIYPFFHGYLFSYLYRRSKTRGTWFLLFMTLFVLSFTHLTSSGIQSMNIVFLLIWIFCISKTKAIT